MLVLNQIGQGVPVGVETATWIIGLIPFAVVVAKDLATWREQFFSGTALTDSGSDFATWA